MLAVPRPTGGSASGPDCMKLTARNMQGLYKSARVSLVAWTLTIGEETRTGSSWSYLGLSKMYDRRSLVGMCNFSAGSKIILTFNMQLKNKLVEKENNVFICTYFIDDRLPEHSPHLLKKRREPMPSSITTADDRG